MKKFLQKKLKDQKGMTLIELLAVIVIIAIIAAIAIPAIGSLIENSRNGAVKADYQNALAAANIYFTENDARAGETVTVENLLDENYLDDAGSLTDGVTVTKADGGNTITGSAGDGTAGDGGSTSYPYNIGTGLTNNQITGIPNKVFKGAITASLVE